jgi:hypothetical protein
MPGWEFLGTVQLRLGELLPQPRPPWLTLPWLASPWLASLRLNPPGSVRFRDGRNGRFEAPLSGIHAARLSRAFRVPLPVLHNCIEAASAGTSSARAVQRFQGAIQARRDRAQGPGESPMRAACRGCEDANPQITAYATIRETIAALIPLSPGGPALFGLRRWTNGDAAGGAGGGLTGNRRA